MNTIDTIITILLTLFVFGLIITIHELGHLVAAKLCKIYVIEFAIGFGPKLFSIQGKETKYSVRLIPFGGFCAMLGEESKEDDDENPFEDYSHIPDDRRFNKKKVWQRMIVILAGSFMNIVLGIVAISAVMAISPYYVSTIVAEFNDNATTNSYGLQVNDEILAIDGYGVLTYNDLNYGILRDHDGVVDITVNRDGERMVIEDVKFNVTEEEGNPVPSVDIDFKVYALEKTPGEFVSQVYRNTVSTAKSIWFSLYDMITGRWGINQLSGPVGTAEIIGESAKIGIDAFLYMIALITINLGIFNLLPVPGLDGGKFIFLIYEAIFRKPINPKYENIVTIVGFALLISLMVFVLFNDIVRLITG